MPFTEAAAAAQPAAILAPRSVPSGGAAAVGSEPALADVADVAARPAQPGEGIPSVPPAVSLAALLPADEEEDDYD